MKHYQLNLTGEAQSFADLEDFYSIVSNSGDGLLSESYFSKSGNPEGSYVFNSNGIPCLYHDSSLYICGEQNLIIILYKDLDKPIKADGYNFKRVISSDNDRVLIFVDNSHGKQGILEVRYDSSIHFEMFGDRDDSIYLDCTSSKKLLRGQYCGTTELKWLEYYDNKDYIKGCFNAFKILPDGAILGEAYSPSDDPKNRQGDSTLAIFSNGNVCSLYGPQGENTKLASDKKLLIYDDERVLTLAALCYLDDQTEPVALLWQTEEYYNYEYGFAGKALPRELSSRDSEWYCGENGSLLIVTKTKLFQQRKSLVFDLTSVVR